MPRADEVDTDEPGLSHLDCISGRGEECSGRVGWRMSLSGTGIPYPRCDRHWRGRLDVEDRLNRDYPDSPYPPAWFDPTAIGETWDGND